MAKQQITNIPKQISTTLNSVNKTISSNQSLKININSNIILEKEDTLNLPSISSLFNYEDMRGASDSFALKKKHHNEKLLNQITNQNIDIKEEIIFLERIRYEYLGSQNFLGIKRNIQSKWIKRLESIKLKKQSDLLDLLLFTLTHFFLDASNGKIWTKKNEYLKKISTKENHIKIYEYLINFIEVIDNQKLFANNSIELLRLIFPKQQDENNPEDKNTEDGPQEEDVNQQQNNEENQKSSPRSVRA